MSNMSRNSFAPGKIILSGEYAVLFGYAGIAVPASLGVRVVFEEDPQYKHLEILWEEAQGEESFLNYAEKVVALCQTQGNFRGRLTIHSNLPLGKGMGSSTALIIAIVRALLGEGARAQALQIEDTLNLGHSGVDFATIWEGRPVLFRKGTLAQHIDIPSTLLHAATLIDTGLPSESTMALMAAMRNRESEIHDALSIIGACTDRLMQGEPLNLVMRDHHKAQVALGVVPPAVQDLIAAIEKRGGSAKVIGAGSHRGGAGMVLALGNIDAIQDIADERGMSTMQV